MIVLGIETSCDETAAALVERRADGSGSILADIVLSQVADHAIFGGVVPEIAARAHVEALDGVIAAAMRAGNKRFADVDAVAATAGPGLIAGVIVGLTTAKAIALAAGKPLIAVNHLEGHALTARLTDNLAFPYLLLLVSGGHTQFLAVEGVGRYRRLGTTIDDALGEAFDKAAKLLGLPYPGGPTVEEAARRGNGRRFALPRPLLGRPGADFSLSGLKTALRLAAEAIAPLSELDVADLAASFQAAVTDVVADRARHAMAMFSQMRSASLAEQAPPLPSGERALRLGETKLSLGAKGERALPSPRTTEPPHPDPLPSGEREHALVVAGGVAANQAIRARLAAVAAEAGFRFVAPPARLCADNGVMIAWAGAERLALGLTDPLDAPALPRWPLDTAAAGVRR
jgi:N6-L-threonylcarbamoyladenine synthase